MVCTINEFATTWRSESSITSRVLGALTDPSLEQRVTARDRSLGDIAWHLATAIPEMAAGTGLVIPGGDHRAPAPTSARKIRDAYDEAAAALLAAVVESWTDTALQLEDMMYGESWKRGLTLSVLIVHEIHHRGQMTVLMRQAGLSVPSIYGPNREETEAMRG